MGKTALSIGANTFAFFTRNPRGGSVRQLDLGDVAALRSLMTEYSFGPLVAHAPYTYNPCSAKERAREFALEAMGEDLRRMEALPGNYYNFHPGAHVGQGVERGIELIADALCQVMFEGQRTCVLLETMAGKGTEVGSHFEELAAIIDAVRVRRPELDECLGVCLDTCHVSDAGYDIVHDLDGVLDEFDRVVGASRLRAVHINDSKNPCGAHKDRHEVIGAGYLGSAELGGARTCLRASFPIRACATCHLSWRRPTSLRAMRVRLSCCGVCRQTSRFPVCFQLWIKISLFCYRALFRRAIMHGGA